MTEKNKVVTLCPTCLKPIHKVKSTVHCPKVNNAAVCMSHCFTLCGYMNQEMSLQRCTYSSNKESKRGGKPNKKIGLH